MSQLNQLNCDWPGCEGGIAASEFVDQGETHRPVCQDHGDVAREQGATVRPIHEVDPNKVPFKYPTQKERDFVSSYGFRWPKGDGESDRPPPPPEPRTSRPPLRDAFLNLASALLDKAKEEVERWRR